MCRILMPYELRNAERLTLNSTIRPTMESMMDHSSC